MPFSTLFQVDDIVEFVKSPTDPEKFALYRECDTVLYTPPNEHFGIVPIEALQQRRPVIVCDSGGPAETVVEGITGSKVIPFSLLVRLLSSQESLFLFPVNYVLDLLGILIIHIITTTINDILSSQNFLVLFASSLRIFD